MNKLKCHFDESKYKLLDMSNKEFDHIIFQEKESNQNLFTLNCKSDRFYIRTFTKDVPMLINGQNFIIHYDHAFEAYYSELQLRAIECEGIKITYQINS
jgi:hypothetical protein